MDRDNSGSRPMFKGNWTCSNCGDSITELPFQPKDDSSVLCRKCHAEKRGDRGDRRGGGMQRERRMFKGDWHCSKCNTAITELPFEPRDPSTLFCKDCFRKEKGF